MVEISWWFPLLQPPGFTHFAVQVTYNSAISACDTAELWYEALSLFETCCEGHSAEAWFEPGWETPGAHKNP